MKMKMKMNMKMKIEPLFYHSFLTCSCFLFAFRNFLGFLHFSYLGPMGPQIVSRENGRASGLTQKNLRSHGHPMRPHGPQSKKKQAKTFKNK